MADKEVDELSGTETTGHEWDGLKELNTPLPKWWLYTFYATVIWAVLYSFAYPSFPYMDGFKGFLGWTSREAVREEIVDADKAKEPFRKALLETDFAEVAGNPDLLRFAMANGRAAFGDNCAPCHGSGAEGSTGYPNLNDDNWLWGGKVDDIYNTILYGIRSGHDETRANEMPAFGKDEILDAAQILNVTGYVLSLSGQSVEGADIAAGKTIFEENCASCHGEDGKGMTELGSPNLTDGIWLYGGDKEDVIASITNSRAGVMPNFNARLDDPTVRSLAIYVHSLGGGQ